MNIHIIACQVFYREISYLAALSPNATTVTWMPQGLHDTPELLRKAVAAEIDRVETAVRENSLKRNPDVIVLGYGLCSNGTCGIRSGTIPILVPRTDDCIGVFLGAQKTYLELFSGYPGTYWLNSGWMESAFLPVAENYAAMREEYARMYGEDNADFLMENETGWIQNYHHCGYIRSCVYEAPGLKEKAEAIARDCGWKFHEFEGSLRLLSRLLSGECQEGDEEILFCPPHHEIVQAYDARKISAVPLTTEAQAEKQTAAGAVKGK